MVRVRVDLSTQNATILKSLRNSQKTPKLLSSPVCSVVNLTHLPHKTRILLHFYPSLTLDLTHESALPLSNVGREFFDVGKEANRDPDPYPRLPHREAS